jgi:hypothetical protein
MWTLVSCSASPPVTLSASLASSSSLTPRAPASSSPPSLSFLSPLLSQWLSFSKRSHSNPSPFLRPPPSPPAASHVHGPYRASARPMSCTPRIVSHSDHSFNDHVTTALAVTPWLIVAHTSAGAARAPAPAAMSCTSASTAHGSCIRCCSNMKHYCCSLTSGTGLQRAPVSRLKRQRPGIRQQRRLRWRGHGVQLCGLVPPDLRRMHICQQRVLSPRRLRRAWYGRLVQAAGPCSL